MLKSESPRKWKMFSRFMIQLDMCSCCVQLFLAFSQWNCQISFVLKTQQAEFWVPHNGNAISLSAWSWYETQRCFPETCLDGFWPSALKTIFGDLPKLSWYCGGKRFSNVTVLERKCDTCRIEANVRNGVKILLEAALQWHWPDLVVLRETVFFLSSSELSPALMMSAVTASVKHNPTAKQSTVTSLEKICFSASFPVCVPTEFLSVLRWKIMCSKLFW